jgi:hypothetical protein
MRRAWKFFHPHALACGTRPSSSLAPLIFSWLAGRGAVAPRINPHASHSEGDLQQHLAVLLRDKDLFTDRLIAADHEQPKIIPSARFERHVPEHRD